MCNVCCIVSNEATERVGRSENNKRIVYLNARTGTDMVKCYFDNDTYTLIIHATDSDTVIRRADVLSFKDNKVRHLIVDNGITQIGYNAFSGWDSIQTVEFPKSLSIIGDYAFYSCHHICCIVYHGRSSVDINIGMNNSNLNLSIWVCDKAVEFNGEPIQELPISKDTYIPFLSKLQSKDNRDEVAHPTHYTQGKIECIDYIVDKKLDFCLGNAIKYITRAGHKASAEMSQREKTVQDLEKAKQYIDFEIQKVLKDSNNGNNKNS